MDEASNSVSNTDTPVTRDTKRGNLLAACRNSQDKESGIAYCDLETIREKYEAAIETSVNRDAFKWIKSERDTIRKLVQLLDDQHDPSTGKLSPLLRVTEKGPQLPSGKWVAFVDSTSRYLGDLRQVADWAKSTRRPGTGDRSWANTYVFELYFILYLLRREILPCPSDKLIARISELTNGPLVTRFAAEPQYRKPSFLRGLPDQVKMGPALVLAELDEYLQKLRAGSFIPSHSSSEWSEQYLGWLVKTAEHENFIPLETRLFEPKDRTTNLAQSDAARYPSVGPPAKPAEVLPKHNRLVLLGESGTGKSWLVHHTAVTWINYRRTEPVDCRIAIVVQLQDFNLTQDMTRLVTDAVCDIVGAPYQAQVERWLHSDEGRSEAVLLLFDGFNEILGTNRQPFNRAFTKFLAARSNRILLSTRTYDSGLVQPEWPRLILSKLSSEHICDYLTQRLGDMGRQVYSVQIKDSPQLHSLAQIPFFLNLLVRYVQSRGFAKIPTDRAGLLRAIIDDSLTRKLAQEAVQIPTTVSIPEIRDFLAMVAHSLLRRPERTFVHPKDTRPLWNEPGVRVQEILEYCELVGILASSGCGKDDDRVLFIHDLFRDFFAGQKLYEEFNERNEQFLASLGQEYLEYMHWDEALLMLADQLRGVSGARIICHSIAQIDVYLAARFAFRASCIDKEILRSFLPALAWHSAFDFGVDPGIPNYDYAASELLSSLSLEQLTTLYQAVPVEANLHRYIPIAAYIRSDNKGLKHLSETRVVSSCEGAVELGLITALAYSSDPEALEKAITLARSITDTTDEPLEWNFVLGRVFRGWKGDLTANQVGSAIQAPENRGIRNALYPLFLKVSLSITDLTILEPLLMDRIDSWNLFLGPTFTINEAVLESIRRIGGKEAAAALREPLKRILGKRTRKRDSFQIPDLTEQGTILDESICSLITSLVRIGTRTDVETVVRLVSEIAKPVLISREELARLIVDSSEVDLSEDEVIRETREFLDEQCASDYERFIANLIEVLAEDGSEGALLCAAGIISFCAGGTTDVDVCVDLENKLACDILRQTRAEHPIARLRARAAVVLGLVGVQECGVDNWRILNAYVIKDCLENKRAVDNGEERKDRAKLRALLYRFKESVLSREFVGLAIKALSATEYGQDSSFLLSLANSKVYGADLQDRICLCLAQLGQVECTKLLLEYIDGCNPTRFSAAIALRNLATRTTEDAVIALLSAMKERWGEFSISEDVHGVARTIQKVALEVLVDSQRRYAHDLAGWPLGVGAYPEDYVPGGFSEYTRVLNGI